MKKGRKRSRRETERERIARMFRKLDDPKSAASKRHKKILAKLERMLKPLSAAIARSEHFTAADFSVTITV